MRVSKTNAPEALGSKTQTTAPTGVGVDCFFSVSNGGRPRGSRVAVRHSMGFADRAVRVDGGHCNDLYGL